MQYFCTARDAIPKHETDTQHKRGLFAKRRTYRKKKKQKQSSQPCIFLYTQRDTHPYASREGHGTTPSTKCQWWSAMRPFGAAMRLTASRQPYDISKPKNSKHPKTIPNHQNDPFTPPFYNCRPTTANTEQGESTGPHSAPYGEAARRPTNRRAKTSCLNCPQLTQGPASIAHPLTQQL